MENIWFLMENIWFFWFLMENIWLVWTCNGWVAAGGSWYKGNWPIDWIGLNLRWVGRGRRSEERDDNKTRQNNNFSMSFNPQPCARGKDKPFGQPPHSNLQVLGPNRCPKEIRRQHTCMQFLKVPRCNMQVCWNPARSTLFYIIFDPHAHRKIIDMVIWNRMH